MRNTKTRGCGWMAKAVIALMSMLIGAFLLPQKAVACDKQELFEAVNAVRDFYGLSQLELDPEFSELAFERAKEQEEKFSHTRPDGSKWYTIDSRVMRENIAKATDESQSESKNIIIAWLLSDTHRANLLAESPSRCGIGIYQSNDNEQYIVLLTD